jgi:heme-degrading monooxygenase HmoA
MIARVWKAYVVPEKVHLYLEHLENSIFPELDQIGGFRGAQVLRRTQDGDVEITVMTLWESMDAIHQFAGENAELAVVAPAAQAVLRAYDATVTHYEVALQK